MVEEKRSGIERREQPPLCMTPCPAISEALESKVSTSFYKWSFGGLCFFVVVIIGTFLWGLLESQNKTTQAFITELGTIKSSVAVSAYQINNVISGFEKRVDKVDNKFEKIDNEMKQLENDHNNLLRKQYGGKIP